MRLHATTEVVRVMGSLVRRADSGLARSAARNAASSVHARHSREIEDARTLHDLQKIPTASARSGLTGRQRASH
jgi:hypothetical protein